MRPQRPLMIGSLRMIASEQITQPRAQSRPAHRAERHQRIERGSGAGLNRARRQRPQQPRATAKIQNLVSDSNPNRSPRSPRKHAKGQVLDRECVAGAIGGKNPALPLRIMRSIHGYIYGIGFPVKCFFSACHT